jgi:hypothetical protein
MGISKLVGGEARVLSRSLLGRLLDRQDGVIIFTMTRIPNLMLARITYTCALASRMATASTYLVLLKSISANKLHGPSSP